jgi:hypothetical protein
MRTSTAARVALVSILDEARDTIRFEATQALFALTGKFELNDAIVLRRVA